MEVAMSKNEKLHREMWHWIAEETRKQKRKVIKYEYFNHNKTQLVPAASCFACQEAIKRCPTGGDAGRYCQYCPLKWGTEKSYASDFCLRGDTLFCQWMMIGAGLSDWQVAADLADRIAEMEWKK